MKLNWLCIAAIDSPHEYDGGKRIAKELKSAFEGRGFTREWLKIMKEHLKPPLASKT